MTARKVKDGEKIEIDVNKMIDEAGGKQQAAMSFLESGVSKEEIAQKLAIDPKLLDQWEQALYDEEEEPEEEAKVPKPDMTSESPRDTWSLDRVQAILKNRGLQREDLAAELVRQEAQIRRLEDIISKQGKTADGGFDMGDGLFGADDLKFMKEMMNASMKMAMQKKMMNSMIGDSDDGGGGSVNKRLMERLERLEKKDEVERMIGPIRDQLESLTKLANTKGGDIDPAMKAQIDSLKDTITKYDMEKKQHDMLSDFTKAAKQSEDPLKVMKDMEEMRSRYAEEAKKLEMEVQRQRDENMRMLLERALGDMAKKIDDLEHRSGGQYNVNDIRSLSETVKTIKEVSKELGGGNPDDKPSLSDKIIESTVNSLGQSVPKFLDVYKEMKKNAPPQSMRQPEHQEYPDQIVLSPEEVDELYRRRMERETKKKSPPKFNPVPQPVQQPVQPKPMIRPTPVPAPEPIVEIVPKQEVNFEPTPEPNASVDVTTTVDQPYDGSYDPSVFLPEDTTYNQIVKGKENPAPEPVEVYSNPAPEPIVETPQQDINDEATVVNDEPPKRRGRPRKSDK